MKRDDSITESALSVRRSYSPPHAQFDRHAFSVTDIHASTVEDNTFTDAITR